MKNNLKAEAIEASKEVAEKTVISILLTISLSHLLKDTLQSLIPSIYPMVKETYALVFHRSHSI
jgi:FSR family fosmidomycin resistance protein-like MFS transporter